MTSKTAQTTFRVLGTALGLFGLFSLCAIAYLVGSGRISEFTSRPATWNLIGAISAVFEVLFLLACSVATWRYPARAPLFAWAAAYSYVIPGLVLGGLFKFGLMGAFYYGSTVRLVAAWSMSLLRKRFAAAG